MPARTWIERQLPDYGSGPCTANFWGACKEVHPAFNYANGRVFYFGGDYATTFIPPGVSGYKKFDLFDSTANPEGQPEKAIALYEQERKAGKPCPSTIHVAYRDSGYYKRLLSTVVDAYQLAGIQVIPVP